jgi:2-amino-4-hydroxy-6-hydroxymethyldihydropteridine diphosphokinase
LLQLRKQMLFGSLKFYPPLLFTFLCLIMTMFSLVMPRVAVLPVKMATTRRSNSLWAFARQHIHKSSIITGSISSKTAPLRRSNLHLIGMRGGEMTPDARHLHSAASLSPSPTPTTPANTTELPLYRHRVYLAVGSNLGDRFQNIQNALTMLCSEESTPPQIRLIRTSFLHETAPMYVTDQPAFLNGAVELETDWEPHELLRRIKVVEAKMGRDLEGGIRNGPRPVDLDILLYETRRDDDDHDGQDGTSSTWKPFRVDTPDLVIPHIRIQEREFVLAPLCEAAGRDLVHPVLHETIGDLCNRLELTAVRVVPLARGRMLCFNETIVMGILNVTPDSFSDGGQWSSSIERAALRALEMVQEGAGIIDIGGESTRPGAKEVAVEEEIQRTIAVIERIRQGTSYFLIHTFLVKL